MKLDVRRLGVLEVSDDGMIEYGLIEVNCLQNALGAESTVWKKQLCERRVSRNVLGRIMH